MQKPLTRDLGHIRPDLLQMIWKVHQDKRRGWTKIIPRYPLIEGLELVRSPQDLLRIVERRRADQGKLYGVQSQLPIYTLPASRRVCEDRADLRVAMVQTLLPRIRDFDQKNPLYWSQGYRRQHRAHLASVCRPVAQYLATETAAKRKTGTDGKNNGGSNVNWIVLPELSVHPDDLWLLRSLSDTTKANLFVGLTFEKGLANKPVNRSLWMLRLDRTGHREIVRINQGKHHMT